MNRQRTRQYIWSLLSIFCHFWVISMWLSDVLCQIFYLHSRLWLWKLLQVRRAPLHLVWKPTLCSSGSFWRQRIWRTSPWYMGELGIPQKSHFALPEGLWTLKIITSTGITHMLYCFLLTESRSGVVCTCLWFSAFRWTQFTNSEAKSAGGAVPHPLLHVRRYFFPILNVRKGTTEKGVADLFLLGAMTDGADFAAGNRFVFMYPVISVGQPL